MDFLHFYLLSYRDLTLRLQLIENLRAVAIVMNTTLFLS